MKVELDRCVMITIMREGRFLKAETSEDPTGNPVCRWREISSKDALSKVQQYTREGLLKRQREAHPFEAKIKKLLLKVLLKREERIDQLERVADRMLHVLPRK